MNYLRFLDEFKLSYQVTKNIEDNLKFVFDKLEKQKEADKIDEEMNSKDYAKKQHKVLMKELSKLKPKSSIVDG